MPGAQTELTRRLEISRRQFFQWHLVERLHLPDVKKRMDELTNALVDADYHFNFVAEHVSPLSTRIELADNESCYREKHWKSRSRTWNVTRAKTAWEVKHHQKGRDLPIPAEIATLPVWVEWGQDVGDWRNNRSNEEASQNSLVQAEEHQISHHKISDRYGQRQGITVANNHDALDASHASLTPPASTETYSYPFNPLEQYYTPFPPFSPGPTPWPQQNSEATVTVPFHLLPQPGQPSNILQDYNYSQNLYNQSIEAVTPASSISPSLLNPIHRSDHDPITYMSEMDLSQMRLDNWLREGATSSVDIHTQQYRNLHHNQHQSTDLAAGDHMGIPVPQRTTNEWDGSQKDSTSQEDANWI